MSTRINTNTTAYMASMNLNASSDNLSTDIQRLSTGLRINSAADDAAGLVISENMMAQVSGLNQATKNSNDAINMIKTAEGSLNEVQNLLISMRQLAVHASNLGVNSSTDVQADQTQIASAIQSINRIATTTQFSNKNLLDGSATSALTTTNGSASAASGSGFSVVAQGAWSANSAYNYTSNQLSATTQATDTFATTNTGGATPATITSANTNFGGSVAINGVTYNITGSSATNLASFNTLIAASGYQAAIAGNGNITFTAQANGPTTAPTVDTSKLVLSGSVAATGAGTASGAAVTYASASGTGGKLAASVASFAIGSGNENKVTVAGTLDLQETGGGGLSFSKAYAPGTSIGQLQADLNTAFGNGKVTVSTDASNNLVFTDTNAGVTALTNTGSSGFAAYNAVQPPTTGTFTNGANAALTISDGNGHSIVSQSTVVNGGTSYYTFQNGLVLSSTTAASTSGTTAINGTLNTTAGKTTSGVDLQFQVGANGGQTASQSIQSVAGDQLGKGAASYTDASGATQSVLTGSVQDINVTTFKGAQDAIAVIDKAISDISTVRANLGAFQSNVLQSNVRSLGVASTNLSASESTIRDTDLAATIVDYTKNQILVQAGTSALSYANQMPQSVLKLLQ